MRTTIKDIARATGFSVTTVSLVLNGKAHKIPENTKQIVLETAKQLNYHPNQVAVSLVKRRSKTIGLILPDIRNPYFANMARGIDEACREYGRTVIICNTNDLQERDREYVNMLVDKGVDGIIYVMAKDSSLGKNRQILKLMEDVRMPYILLDRSLTGADDPVIEMDHLAGGYMATRYLIELGHSRIACVKGAEGLSDSERRFQGYLKAMAEYHVPVDNNLIYEGDYSPEGGAEAVDYFVKHDFTAIFACNDASAYGVCRQLKKYHKKVPDDISVVGYDDVSYAEMLEPPLTTIRQHVYKMGMEAVKQLLNCIKTKDKMKKTIMLEPELIIRKSAARRNETNEEIFSLT